MGPKTLNIVIKRGTGVQGPAPDFKHLESPEGEVHTVDAAFGWGLVAEGRATPADGETASPGMTDLMDERSRPGQPRGRR